MEAQESPQDEDVIRTDQAIKDMDISVLTSEVIDRIKPLNKTIISPLIKGNGD